MKCFKSTLALWAGMVCALAAQAQVLTTEQDWQEGEIPAPPAFELNTLAPFDVSVNSSMRFGVAANSLTVGADGVIRYVVVARSPSGALNVAYEGLRCKSGEMKTYARWSPTVAEPKLAKTSQDGQWQMASRPEWRELNSPGAQPAKALARQGFCEGPTPNGTPEKILRALKSNSFRGG